MRRPRKSLLPMLRAGPDIGWPRGIYIQVCLTGLHPPAPGLFSGIAPDCAVVVSQAATLRLKTTKSNNIKVFIVFILNHLLYFAFSHIDDIEFTGIKTGKILDFSPMGRVRRSRNGSPTFQQSEPGLQEIVQPFFPSHGLDLALNTK